MSKDQLVRFSQLLDEALELDEDGRTKWLEALPAESLDLKDALRQTLSATDLELTLPALGGGLADDRFTLKPGDPAGPYRLSREIARGGMAQIWLATRADNLLKREVALKIPAVDLLVPGLQERFAVERDILAALEHPNIARLYDAGMTDGGLPYLAMEYVRGKSILAWADERELGIRARVDLYLQVLDAVEYAHQRGVLHRDIKPSNVLVNESGQVRLLDFGVAKLLQQRDDLTQPHDRRLTPAYASPEQLRGEKLQTASDIYSLGAMLCELLCGRRPRVTRSGLEASAAPSTRIDAHAASTRGIGAATLVKVLRGDLDSIVLKATALDPSDRYPSAAALAEDLKRYLAGEPVHARGAHATYRLGKLLHRHWLNSALAAGALLAIALAAIFTFDRREPTMAPRQAVALSVPPSSDRSIVVLPFIDLSEKRDQEYFSDGLSEELGERLAHSPDLRVVSRTSAFYFKGKQATVEEIGSKLHVSHVLEGSVRKSGNALRIKVELIRVSDGVQLWSQTYDRDLVGIFKVQTDIADRVARALEVALDGPAEPAEGDVEAYNLLLKGRYFWNRNSEADSRRALAYYQKAIERDRDYAMAWALLGQVHMNRASNGWALMSDADPKARAASERALSIDPRLATAHRTLGYVSLWFDWNWKEAGDHLQRAVELDPADRDAAHDLAWLRQGLLGRFDECLDIDRKRSERDPLNLLALGSWGDDLYYARRWEESVARYRELVQLNPGYASAYAGLAYSLMMLKRYDEALQVGLKESDAMWRLQTLPAAYWALGRRRESEASLKELEAKYAGVSAYNIAALHAYRGESDAAFAWLDRAYRQHDAGLPTLPVDAFADSLRSDPRYLALMAKMKLDEIRPTTQPATAADGLVHR